ncbi:uncharacterized protein LOC117322187 [Pecten maximus]|uniref:uncharacterized protein LOC117322187 n=1 Tax=Pecten maximus TaxID=6579 RepID=UPI001458B6CD|nr:uncharacterized protein LOC117322187 [Pecten maximus]
MASGNAVPRAQLHIRAKGNTKCKDHKDNDVIFLYQNCKTLICQTCSISTHISHIKSFVEISKINKENQSVIQIFFNETDNVNIPKLNQEIISSRTKMTSCRPQYENLRKQIIDNNNQCKLELDKITDDYIKFCDKMEVAAMDLIQTHITNLEERLDTLKQLSSEYKQTLQTGTAVLVYDSVSEIREMDSDIPPTPDIDMAEFTPGMDRLSHLKQAIGNLKLPTDHLQAGLATGGHSDQRPVVRPKQSTETGQASPGEVRYKLRDRPTVMSQFTYPGITSICPTSDGRAWLCNCTDNTVNIIDNQGQVIQTIRHSSDIEDISLDPTTGRLWFCCWGDKTICEVSTQSTPVTRFTTEGGPVRLCVTREGRVVVGTGGIGQVYKVWVYTVDGQVLHTAIVEGGSRVNITMWCYR